MMNQVKAHCLALQGYATPQDNHRLLMALTKINGLSALAALPRKWLEAKRFSAAFVDALKQPDVARIERHKRWLDDNANHHYVTLFDDDYPALLRQLPDPPLGLFVKGNKALLKQFQVALVGARKASPTGLEFATTVARQLAGVGLVITSGLAHGVDAAAHQGAIAENAPTLAVVGTGLDQVYPRAHVTLAERIVASGGALVSEFPLMSAPRRRHFPQRNRVIAGLSLGTCVVEAALRSGSLITARLALKYHREVFAVPGSPYNQFAKGCNRLIQQGAKLITSSEEILTELPFLMQSTIASADQDGDNSPNKTSFEQKTNVVLQKIGFEPTSVDKIVSRCQFSVAEVIAILSALELSQQISSTPGGFVKVATTTNNR